MLVLTPYSLNGEVGGDVVVIPVILPLPDAVVYELARLPEEPETRVIIYEPRVKSGIGTK